MAFRRSLLKGPCWTADGRVKLSPQQHQRVAVVQRMSCELYNTMLESWKNQWQWHQRSHQHDTTEITDIYDEHRITGDRGTLYRQFTEHRRTETRNTVSDSDVLWGDLALQIGRGVVNRFDKARTSFYQRCAAKQQGRNIKAGYPRFKPWRQWTTVEIPAPKSGMVQPPANDGKWSKLKIKRLGVVEGDPVVSPSDVSPACWTAVVRVRRLWVVVGGVAHSDVARVLLVPLF